MTLRVNEQVSALVWACSSSHFAVQSVILYKLYVHSAAVWVVCIGPLYNRCAFDFITTSTRPIKRIDLQYLSATWTAATRSQGHSTVRGNSLSYVQNVEECE